MNDPRMKKALGCHLNRAARAIITPTFKIGGCPVLFEDIYWPECESCDSEMDFIAQVPLQDPILLSQQFAMAYVFMCPSNCATWEPDSGCNRVILQSQSAHAVIGTRTNTPDFGAYPDYEVRPEDSREDYDQTKLGGVPDWLQADETPTCPECGDVTTFVAQLDAALDGPMPADPEVWDKYYFLKFGDSGRGYLFICKHDCSSDGAVFLWQCY